MKNILTFRNPISNQVLSTADGNDQPFDVFISYRRSGGAELATLIYTNLKARGYRVFLDVLTMPSGPFDKSLARVVKLSKDVVVVLTHGSLDRHSDSQDWFYEEISLALDTKVNVVPFRQQQYQLPPAQSLPEVLRPICKHQSVIYIHGRTESCLDDLCRLLRARPRRRTARRLVAIGSAVLIGLVAAIAAWTARGSLSSLLIAKSAPPRLEIYELKDNTRLPVEGPALSPGDRLVLVPYVAAGKHPYVLEIRGDGTAKVFTLDQMKSVDWQWKIEVPHTSDTILLLASDHLMGELERQELERSVSGLRIKPEVAVATEVRWTLDGPQTTRTKLGSRGPPEVVDSDWQGRTLSVLRSLKGITFGGVSLPIEGVPQADDAGK